MTLLYRIGDAVELRDTDPPLVARVTAVRGERVRVADTDRAGVQVTRWLAPAPCVAVLAR